MNPIQKMKNSPHYLRLKESVEYRYDKKQFLLIFVSIGLLALPILITGIVLLGRSGNSSAMYSMVWFMFLGFGYLMLLLYFAYRWLEIFLHIDSYIFCEVLLDQPHVQGRGGVKFTVTFTDRHGKQLKRETSTMFSSSWEPYLEDYNNQKVLIGYNEETDRVVVIKRIDG